MCGEVSKFWPTPEIFPTRASKPILANCEIFLRGPGPCLRALQGRAGGVIAAFPHAKTAARQFSQNLSGVNDNSVLDLSETQKLAIDVLQRHRLGLQA
jgi:hypothetical protein